MNPNFLNSVNIGKIASNLNRILDVANKAIPLYNKVKPILNNASTLSNMLKIINTNENNDISSQINEKTSNQIKKENRNLPTFFQ